VYPDGLEGTWTVGCDDCTAAHALKAEDVSFLETLTRHLAEHLPVDTSRAYIAGYSQGGSLAHLYACTSSMPPAGIAAVASLMYRNVGADCSPGKPFPVALVHGTHDVLAYYSGFGLEAPLLPIPETVELWAEKMDCAQTPRIEEIPDMAGDWTTITSFRFDGCEAPSSVLHFRVNNGGHTWPGPTGPWGGITGKHSRNLDATREILKFFASVAEGS
jgi:polyhydroxybutyrate depolymerase